MPGTGNHDRYWTVALVLAVGLATALNLFTFAILYDALFHTNQSGISENAVQVLTGWGGGVVGIIGAYVGYQAGRSNTPPSSSTDLDPTPGGEQETPAPGSR